MNGLKFVFLLPLAIVLLLSEGRVLPSADKRGCSVSPASASQTTNSISDWQVYSDPDFKIIFQYPEKWEIKTTIEQTYPYVDPYAILKRFTLIGKEGMIDFDIWSLNGYEFTDWLEWYGQTRSPLPITTTNAKIAGNDAIVFVKNGETVDLMTAFWSDGKNVYRLWYTVTQNKTGLDVYYHILDNVALSGKEVISSEIPDSIKQDALKSVEESELISPLLSSCCGYNSPGNPFPCCDNKGNCTWWVWYRYTVPLPFRGDAWTWWEQVPDYPDWGRRSTPRQNPGENIAWWNKSASNNNLGHVAYVANYTGGNYVSLTEMAYCTICYRARTIPATNPNGYIFLWKYPQP